VPIVIVEQSPRHLDAKRRLVAALHGVSRDRHAEYERCGRGAT
jgi:hypothetical protein